MTKIYVSMALVAVQFFNAQLFERVPDTPFKNFFFSSSAVGDYNNDGFQDVFFTGAIDPNGGGNVNTTFNELYANANGNFSVAQSFSENAVHLSSSRFIDFDNDGLLDLVTSGLSYNDIVNYRQYRWRNTGNGFELTSELPGKIYGGIAVMDLDHDGKQDYAANGLEFRNDEWSHTIDFYQNNGQGYTAHEALLPGTSNGAFLWLDIDNDTELDLVVNGYNADDNSVFQVYRNTGGNNFELFQELEPVTNGNMRFADFNQDGFNDLVVTGLNAEDEHYLAYFLNDGTGHFTENILSGEGLAAATVDVGDLNSDGYYDFAVAGEDENYEAFTKIFFYNPETNGFVKAENTGLYSLGSAGSLQIFDYDNDQSLDLLVNGWDWADPDYKPATHLYRNTSPMANARPAAPQTFSAVQEENKIVFSWSGASDDKTQEKALQYELSVGSEPGKADLAKYIVSTPKWYLNSAALPEKMYWSVKSIDASKVRSEASPEKVLTLLSTAANALPTISFYPNPVQDQLMIKAGNKVKSAAVYTMAGQKMAVEAVENRIDFRKMQTGIYLVTVVLDNGTSVTRKIVKK